MKIERSETEQELDHIDFIAHLDEISQIAHDYPTTWESCLVNAQDMGYEPWSDAEALEALRQARNIIDAGEAS